MQLTTCYKIHSGACTCTVFFFYLSQETKKKSLENSSDWSFFTHRCASLHRLVRIYSYRYRYLNNVLFSCGCNCAIKKGPSFWDPCIGVSDVTCTRSPGGQNNLQMRCRRWAIPKINSPEGWKVSSCFRRFAEHSRVENVIHIFRTGSPLKYVIIWIFFNIKLQLFETYLQMLPLASSIKVNGTNKNGCTPYKVHWL